jgi:type II secretory pathway pseudopilin PulG
MLARARAQAGFTTVELLLAVMILSVGVMSLVGTLDISRRVTTYSEMKEAASHVAEQKMEELRALDYGELALDGNVVPSSSSDPNSPAYYLDGGGTKYKWDQRANAPASHIAEPLIIDAADGEVESIAEPWDDGRLHGQVYRYVTCATTAAGTAADCESGPDTSAYKRLIVAVTVENAMGPQKPIMASTVVSDPDLANGEGSNPTESPDTTCTNPTTGQEESCTESTTGAVSTWYLYDTPATSSTRQEIVASHATHATLTGTPDLMGIDPPPAPAVTPPVYNYSNEITGGTTPGGAVIRRDTTCTGGTPTTTDDTKGHFWVTPPLAADMAVSQAALSISTQTFNGATADAMLCVAFYDVPNSITDLVANPPTFLVSKGVPQTGLKEWPTSAHEEAFVTELYEAGSATIAAGHRLGLRIWPSSSSEADLVVLYDHPLHVSYLQVSG